MGEVTLARDLIRGGPVAIKSVLASTFEDEEGRLRFLRESRITSALSHPNIIRVIDQGVDAGHLFIVLEFEEGGGLGTLLRERGPLSPAVFSDMAVAVLDAVAYAHRAGVLHRDLKTDNILLDGKLQPRIADFGLAKGIDNAGLETTDGQMMGTPIYMAPELARGQRATAATDQYALGVILYQMLANRPPLLAENPLDMLQKHIQVIPPLVSAYRADVPDDLAEIIHRALAKAPHERFPDVAALRDAINGLKPSPGGWGPPAHGLPARPTTTPRVSRPTPALVPIPDNPPRPRVTGSTPALVRLPPDEPVRQSSQQLNTTAVFGQAPPSHGAPATASSAGWTPSAPQAWAPSTPQAAPSVAPVAPTAPAYAPPAAPVEVAAAPQAAAVEPTATPAQNAPLSLGSAAACLLVAGLVVWGSRVDPRPVAVADLARGSVRGAFGLPLGQVVTAAGVAIDGASTGRKADAGTTLLRIEAVNGAPLAQPITVPFTPLPWHPVTAPVAGVRFTYSGYETGAFTGLPEAAAKAIPEAAGTIAWGWTTGFQVIGAGEKGR